MKDKIEILSLPNVPGDVVSTQGDHGCGALDVSALVQRLLEQNLSITTRLARIEQSQETPLRAPTVVDLTGTTGIMTIAASDMDAESCEAVATQWSHDMKVRITELNERFKQLALQFSTARMEVDGCPGADVEDDPEIVGMTFVKEHQLMENLPDRSSFEQLYDAQLESEVDTPLPAHVLAHWRARGFHASLRDGRITLASAALPDDDPAVQLLKEYGFPAEQIAQFQMEVSAPPSYAGGGQGVHSRDTLDMPTRPTPAELLAARTKFDQILDEKQRENEALELQERLRDSGARQSRDDTQQPAFQPATAFQGVRSGWCFKMGSHGLGYYRDLKKQVGVELNDVILLHRDSDDDQISSDSSFHLDPPSEDEECQIAAARAYCNDVLDRKEREYRELERQELRREAAAATGSTTAAAAEEPPPLPDLPPCVFQPTMAPDRDDLAHQRDLKKRPHRTTAAATATTAAADAGPSAVVADTAATGSYLLLPDLEDQFAARMQQHIRVNRAKNKDKPEFTAVRYAPR